MGFIKITKGGTELSVTEGAYRNFYEAKGWTDPSGSRDELYEDEIVDNTDNGITDEELMELPVDDMDKTQLQRLADILEFDYKAEGIKKPKELKKALKELMEQSTEEE